MTISTTTRKAGPFVGNGVTTSFPFVFKVFAKADLKVIRTSVAGVDTTLVLDSTYFVTLNADQDATPGGSVSYSTLAVGEKLTIVGSISVTQPTDITNGSGFYPSVIENALDRLTMFVQESAGKVDRAIKFPVSDTIVPSDLPTATVRAGKALIFSPTGDIALSSTAFEDQAAAAAASAAAAAGSATAAATSATNAQASAVVAGQQATIAGLQAQSALDSAAAAFTSSGNAATSAGAAATSATTAANLLDNFDDRYLGPKASNPTLDNDGNPLLNGALYFNTTLPQMLVYNTATSTWDTLASTTLRNGAGTPGAGLGFNGDFYIDTTNYLIYGPKAGGAWGSGVSLIGPTGPGTGDVIGPAASVNDALALYNGTTGKLIKQSTLSGLLKLTAGVTSAAAANTDYIAPGAITTRAFTQATGRLLGRTTAATGAIEEITPGPGMSFTGGVLDVVPPGSVLLAAITTTASVNVDVLNIANSTYDSYMVTGQGIRGSTGFNNVILQLANAGAADTGSNYQSRTFGAPGYSAATTSITVVGVGTGTGGMNFIAYILNANGTSTSKTVLLQADSQNNVPAYIGNDAASTYSASNSVTGFRLSITGGATFVAGGIIRVYGIKK
jgi:hypothetical protein